MRLKKIFVNNFIQSIIIVSSGNIISQFLSFFTFPIIARLYTPEEFGKVAIFTSVVSIISIFAPIGLTSAIMEPKNDKEASNILISTFYIQEIIIFIISAILLFLSFFYNIYFLDLGINKFASILILFFYSSAVSTSSLLYTLSNRLELNKTLLFNSVIGSMSIILIAIPLGILKIGAIGYLTSFIVSSFLVCFHMYLKMSKIIKIKYTSNILNIIKKYKDYIKFQFPSNLINSLTNQLPIQIIGLNYSKIEIGLYDICDKLFSYPIRYFATPISTIYFRELSKSKQKGNNLNRLTKNLIILILLLGFFVFILLYFYSDLIISLLLGEKWGEVAKLLIILTPQYIIAFANNCISYMLVVGGFQKINLLSSIIKFFTILIPFTIGIMYFNNFYTSMILYGLTSAIFQTLFLNIQFYHYKINRSIINILLSMYILIYIIYFFTYEN